MRGARNCYVRDEGAQHLSDRVHGPTFPGSISTSLGDTLKEMTDLGKLLIVLGIVLVFLGVLLTLVGRAHLPLGRLPGDIVYRRKNTSFYFPLATSILLSIILTLVMYVVNRWRR